MNPPDFQIKPAGRISEAFLSEDIHTFSDAAIFIMNLPYRRNLDKSDLLTVFKDSCGTCSTKHALLKALAIENQFNDLRLMLGMYKMNAMNTPNVASILLEHKLPYLPEAHCYIRYGNQILDFTKSTPLPIIFDEDVLLEIEILPNQIDDFKVEFHKSFLENWLNDSQHEFTLDELWAIRESCIMALH